MRDPDTTWLLFDFLEPGAVAEWGAIDDRVMGCVSSSRLRHDPAGHAVFEGTVSLKRNGGFASIRSTPADCRIRWMGYFRSYSINLCHSSKADCSRFSPLGLPCEIVYLPPLDAIGKKAKP